ncbi:hypothetical protein MASR2M18_10860 [Ignavibacteria bacterium]|nr:TlpA family protein disulfide reductase [Bacteroidota bacterium]MCZ2131674.1 TlpA family protein disulfide reductase [Bacteroidota bacterium]
MKRLAALIAVFCALLDSSGILAGELRFSPEHPQIGGELRASYSAGKTSWNSGSIKLIVYAFAADKSQPTAYQYDFTANGSSEHTTSFTIPKNAVFLLFKVGDGRKFDNNSEKFWEQIIYGKDGKPLEYAYLRAGVSLFGNLMENCRRTADINRALDYLERETALYPDNSHAEIGVLQAKLETKKISKEDFDAQLRAVVTAPFDTTRENLTRSFTRAMKILNMTKQADAIQNRYIAAHPKSELAEEVMIADISSARTKEEFMPATKKFIADFPSSQYAERIADAVISNYLQEDNINGATEFFAPPLKAPAIVMAKISGYYSEKGDIEQAKLWIDRAIVALNDSTVNTRPVFLAPCEWEIDRRNTAATVIGAKAFIEKANHNYEQALGLYRQAVNLADDDAPDDFFAHIVELLSAAGRNKEALDTAATYIAAARQSPEIIGSFNRIYIAVHGSPKGYDSTLAALKERSADARRARLAAGMLNIPLTNGSLTTLDGKTIKIADLKGKVVVMDFWATWCGPCRASFPAMQKLYDKYKNNPNVAFVIVNVWERVEDRKKQVADFLAKNTYTFPVYFDLKDEIVRSLGVTGIPAKFYIDKNGSAQFRDVGFEGEEKFLEAAIDKISVLLQNN